MDPDVLDALRGTLRAVVREPTDRPLADRLDELGWDDVLRDDESTALRTLFEVKGETRADVDALGPLLARELLRAAGLPPEDATVVLGPSLRPDDASATVAGDAVVVDGVVLSSLSPSLIVCAVDAGAPRVALVTRPDGTATSPLSGFDESYGFASVTCHAAADQVRWLDDGTGARAWATATSTGRWAVAAELVAIAQRVVTEAVAYTNEREQFGRPIGTFQALQHRLAAATTLRVGAAAIVAEAARDRDPWTALVAKHVAGHAAERCCTEAQQCYGAIGYTWEHGFHHDLRRVYALDRLLGGWRELEHEIGEQLLATRQVPVIGVLDDGELEPGEQRGRAG